MKFVLASNNNGKLKELRAMLDKFVAAEIFALQDFTTYDVAETGLSFVENAIIKARFACRQANMPAIADDSGLTVNALDAQPGIYSARYAGNDKDYNANNAKLLRELATVKPGNRSAAFVCVIVKMLHQHDPLPKIYTGIWHGEIITEPRGKDGFGYDPLFYIPELGKTAAELTSEQKNNISHRGQAMQALLADLALS